MSVKKSRTKQETNEQTRNPLALAATWVSVLLIVTVVAFLLVEGFGTGAPAAFEVRAGPVREQDGLYYLPLTVTNRSPQSVQGLELRATLRRGERTVAESAVTFDWLPSRSSRNATAVFAQDPGRYDLDTRVVGYIEP